MEFKLPDIGEGIHEAEIVRWLVQEGQAVKEDQPIVEVMTDKATVEITSPAGGSIGKIMVPEGKTVTVGTALVEIKEGGAAAPPKGEEKQVAQARVQTQQAGQSQGEAKQAEQPRSRDVAASPPAEQKQPSSHITPGPSPDKTLQQQEGTPSPAQAARPAAELQQAYDESAPPAPRGPLTVPDAELAPPRAVPAGNGQGQGKVLATPATRKLAREMGVPLAAVPGSGPQGRVTKEDVRRYASSPAEEQPAQPAAAPAPKPLYIPAGEREQRQPLRGIRKVIARHMVEAKQHVPHFTYVEEVDMSALVALRKSAKPIAEKRGVKLSFLPFIIKAMIAALREFPTLNASLDEERQEVVLKNYYNVGIAAATPDGLIVPVVKNCEAKSVFQVAGEIAELAEKARTNKLAVADLQGGTISITNIGSIGGVVVMPIVNWPEVAILGINKIRQTPVVRDGQIVIRDMMYLSIACDHRVVDGAVAAEFCKRMIQFLEEPQLLLLES